MAQNDQPRFWHRPFNELSPDEIRDFQAIINHWHRPNCDQERIDRGLYLNDHIELKDLSTIEYNEKSIGRVFWLEQDGKKLAYLLSFDTLDLEAHPRVFMRLVANFVPADVSFLRNVIYLERIGFIYHLCAAPAAKNGSYGQLLLRHVMGYYKGRNTRLVISTLDSGQHGILRILKEERKNLVYLNHEFSENNSGEIRLRVAELFEQSTFLRRINARFLPQSYDFVIPMQLNVATESINRMLKQTGLEAEILWTSFFHNVSSLVRFNNIKEFYQGFYHPILRVDKLEGQLEARKFQLKTLREISNYLRDKHEPTNGTPSKVASLVPSLEKRGVGGLEFFFINEDPSAHDFSHFHHPIVYNVYDDDALDNWLRSKEFKNEGPRLSKEDKREWARALAKKVKLEKVEPGESAGRRRESEYWDLIWKEWGEKLMLTKEENEELLRLQRTGEIQNLNPNRKQGERTIIDQINARRIHTPESRKQWRDWFAMHRRLYESDVQLLSKEQRENTWWCHGVVPISYTRGVIGIMFTFTCRKPKKEILEDPRQLMASLADTIANSLSRNMLNIVNKLYLSNFSRALSRFKTAALSARNLSHNVGSHVLSFLSQPAELARLLWKVDKPMILPPKPTHFDRFRGVKNLAGFFDFSKVRMSLLADMATNEPVASTPEWLNSSVLQTFRDQKVLQQYVKGNSQRQVRVIFQNEEAKKGFKDKTDVLVQIPNGTLGLSAFLMIMVNYLRNSIKYAPYQRKGRIDLVLSVEAVNKAKKRISNEPIKSKRLLQLTLHDRVARDAKEARQAARYINETYIKRGKAEEDEFNLAQEGLGFAEMVAAARYLRKRPFGNSWLDPNYTDKEFLQAVTIEHPTDSSQAYLGIRFYLKRPRPLLIIDQAEHWLANPAQQDYLNRMGVKIRYADQLKNWEMESFSHEVGVVLTGELPEHLRSARAFTPRLIYPENTTEFRQLFQSDDVLEMINRSWEHWLTELRKRNQYLEEPDNIIELTDDETETIEKDLVFDDHGNWLKRSSSNEALKDQLSFYEFYRNETPTGLIMQHLTTPQSSMDPGGPGSEDRQEQRLRYMLEEAALTQVVVVDERIQKMLENQWFGKEIGCVQEDAFAYLRGMGVWVPDPKQEGHPNFADPALFQEEEEKLIAFLDQFKGEQAADFLVIHIGLVESMLRRSRGNPAREWIEKHLPENGRTEYIIISGRGKPLDIPLRFRYLPYNNISLTLLKDCPSKYHICQSLYNARTRH